MQVSSLSRNEIEIVLNHARVAVDILYFADSTGTLTIESTKELFTLVRRSWNKPLGLHAHDNLSLAHSNALQSIACGADWQDGTLLGMGRGPGNSKTEFLWIEKQFGSIDYTGVAIMQDFLEKKMAPLLSQYKWGTDSLYYLAGKNQIHPSFVQTLKEDRLFSSEDGIIAIKNLSKKDSRKFELIELTSALSDQDDLSESNKCSPKDFLYNQSVLLLANTESLKKYKNAVEEFIKNSKITVLSLNYTDYINLEFIDYFVLCHPLRIAKNLENISNTNKPTILPFNLIPKDIKLSLKDVSALNYEMQIEAHRFIISKDSCVVPIQDSLAYSLAICGAGEVKNVILAGFDGDSVNIDKYRNIEDMLKNFHALGSGVSLTSITPTNYSINTKSVFGFNR
jgi:4-hydroxy 2-oxovalerate aldolase